MHGLYLLWWVHEKQLPAGVVASLLATGDLAVAALELPAGWLADRFGHRVSLIAGSAIQACAMICCLLGDGIAGVAAAILMVGLGDVLRSGADEALLYRSCQAIDDEQAFRRISAKTHAAELMALVALTVAGGALVAHYGFTAGWIAETALCAVGVVLACAMREPPSIEDEDEPPSPRRLLALSDRRLIVWILRVALLGGFASACSFLVQASGDDPATMTAFVAMVTLAEAFGAWCAGHTASVTRTLWCGCLMALALFGAVLLASSTTVALAVTCAFAVGVAVPLRTAMVQRVAAPNLRASAASLAHACDMVVATIVLPLAGFWRSARPRR